MGRIRKIAIMIDGAYFQKRLRSVVEEKYRDTPEHIVQTIQFMCRRHVQRIIGESLTINARESRWQDHLYRIFYYDAKPYEGNAHHPMTNSKINYTNSTVAQSQWGLFEELKKSRKVALRLGEVIKDDNWILPPKKSKKLLRIQPYLQHLTADKGLDPTIFNEEQIKQFKSILREWQDLQEYEVRLNLKQKGVDMRLGSDITTVALKKQVDTIVLVAGDSNFVPVAKDARREGIEIILDPLRQNVKSDLLEHVDGVQAGLPLKRSDELSE